MRSLHAWSSDLLILFSLLHMVRIYFARAYLEPRRSIDAARETIVRIPLVGSALLSLF